MGTEYTSKKRAHALSELKNVKNPTVMGTKYAWKKVKHLSGDNTAAVVDWYTEYRKCHCKSQPYGHQA